MDLAAGLDTFPTVVYVDMAHRREPLTDSRLACSTRSRTSCRDADHDHTRSLATGPGGPARLRLHSDLIGLLRGLTVFG